MQRLADLSIRDFVEALAQTEPAPGGGAVAAIALAMGAGCARKAIAITRRRNGDDPELVAADARLAAIVREAFEQGDRDSQTFANLIAAYRLPGADDQDKAARKAAIQARASDLVDIGERLIGLGEEVRAILAPIQGRLDPVMANDTHAALSLVDVNRAIQADNVAENRRLAP